MYDLTIELQTDGSKCLYEQIYEYIRQEIREGKLLQGERLPSTRSLAEYLQVSRSTVDVAYEQLLSEGYIEARPYRGYFVCKMEELFRLEEQEKEFGKKSDDDQEAEPKEYAYDFSPTKIDMSCFPFSVWRRINKNVLSEDNARLFTKGNAKS